MTDVLHSAECDIIYTVDGYPIYLTSNPSLCSIDRSGTDTDVCSIDRSGDDSAFGSLTRIGEDSDLCPLNEEDV